MTGALEEALAILLLLLVGPVEGATLEDWERTACMPCQLVWNVPGDMVAGLRRG
jgi:hypothetical protein